MRASRPREDSRIIPIDSCHGSVGSGGGWRTAAASFTRRNIVETEPAPAWWRSKGHGIFDGASRSDGLRRGRKRVAPSLLAPPAGGWQFSGWWHFRVSSRSILVLREPSLDWHHDATPGGAADRCAGAVRVAHCEVTPANRSNCGPWRLWPYGPLDAILPYVTPSSAPDSWAPDDDV